MNLELWTQGLVAMAIGMGTVLCFLCLMIIAMFAMSAVVKKLNEIFPEAIPQAAGVKKAVSSSDEEVAVAILSALFNRK